ncbi:EamA family transporter [Streptomyces sp. TRM68367]|uniref:EamA family transporter n=1 Tax=Streptomyces sp. TRM68367 TaxID=2758415 RepID=UPI00165C36E8|nr:EamA family transporter [Streptomyces sp. TRM68367]MBC9726536.1 EamA family transporter [Streptomyces sp. TRM68367]
MRLILGLLVTAVWGLSFSMIKVAEETFDPLFLLVLRFVLCFLPAAFFLPRPQVPLRQLVSYGLVFGIGQFGLLFFGIQAGLSPGLASVVLQLQVFFTIAFGACFLKEQMTRGQSAGLVLGAAGVILIGMITKGTLTVIGLALVVCAAMSWGIANILVKKMGNADPLGLIVWSSPIPAVILLPCALAIEGYASIESSVRHMDWASFGALLFIAYPTTVIGYSVWNSLLQRYEAGRIAPLTLLVPVFGMASSTLIFDERITTPKAIACGLLILGLCVNQINVHRRKAPATSQVEEKVA